MPLRPIDAIFINPERRQYVVYFRGELWQLPRMKIDHAAWLRRQPYDGDTNHLYLSRNQVLTDPILAQTLRTLNLPDAVRGVTLSRFESWWAFHGFEWLKEQLNEGKSPLAAHQSATPATFEGSPVTSSARTVTSQPVVVATDTEHLPSSASTDIFADMLTELTNEVLNRH
ncbi:hypothetical protein J3492_10735 [Psychrobacter sp. F1192]|uniref:Transposase n=1 Tax=Psychrobacter coccoides TaxID=2818440 RepID=A0ABS3NQJ1_9GAMM|nr:hypothetical protein [Psychrobacter coccoides]MBO1531682.1 hypothetical protein [Psychrobacter coccoides]